MSFDDVTHLATDPVRADSASPLPIVSMNRPLEAASRSRQGG